MDEKNQNVCISIPSFHDFDLADFRKSLGMSQPEFAKEFDISIGTLRKWERKAYRPKFNAPFRRILAAWMDKQIDIRSKSKCSPSIPILLSQLRSNWSESQSCTAAYPFIFTAERKLHG